MNFVAERYEKKNFVYAKIFLITIKKKIDKKIHSNFIEKEMMKHVLLNLENRTVSRGATINDKCFISFKNWGKILTINYE